MIDPDMYTATQSQVITSVETLLQQEFGNEGSGHDWLHINNTRRIAIRLANQENGKINLFVIELAALLHDYDDWKFRDEKGAKPSVRQVLERFNVDAEVVDHVSFITEHISYKGGTNTVKMKTIEGKIVQDADRLEALGATGIARAFMYGGHKSLLLYDPSILPTQTTSFEEYKAREGKNTIINHFYEKLLLLKDQLNTETARKIAERRHNFMLQFLDQFYGEINGEL